MLYRRLIKIRSNFYLNIVKRSSGFYRKDLKEMKGVLAESGFCCYYVAI